MLPRRPDERPCGSSFPQSTGAHECPPGWMDQNIASDVLGHHEEARGKDPWVKAAEPLGTPDSVSSYSVSRVPIIRG